MAELDDAARDAAGAGEADEVRAHHLQHLRAHEAHDEGELEEAEGQHRQHEGFEPARGEKARRPPAELHGFAAPEGGQPAQLHGEEVDEADADEKGRERHADERQRHHHVGEEAVAPDGGVNAEPHARDGGEERREHRELDGRGQAFGDERRDRARLAVGDAEIALGGIAEEAEELDREGLVEAKALREFGAVLQRRFLAHHVGDRIADEAEHGKGDESHSDENERSLEKAAEDEGDHSGARKRKRSARGRALPSLYQLITCP
jgi:hypothetical protein